MTTFGVLLISESDTLATEYTREAEGGGETASVDGDLWAMDQIVRPRPRLFRLTTPMPDGVAFHAAGLGLAGDVLFVVNHAGSKGGERVERFRITQRTPATVLDAPMALEHLGSVVLEEAGARLTEDGALDLFAADVAPVSPTEFFVATGLKTADVLDERWGLESLLPAVVFPRLRTSRLLRCHAERVNASFACERIGPAAVSWTSVAASNAGNVLYANDFYRKRVVALAVRRSGDDVVSLEELGGVPLPHVVDRISLDPSGHWLWAGFVKEPRALGRFAAAVRQRFRAAHVAYEAQNGFRKRDRRHYVRRGAGTERRGAFEFFARRAERTWSRTASRSRGALRATSPPQTVSGDGPRLSPRRRRDPSPRNYLFLNAPSNFET